MPGPGPATIPDRPDPSRDAMAAHHHTKPAPPKPPPSPPNELESLRFNIARTIKRFFSPLFLVTLGFAVFLCVIIGTKLVTADVMEKMALAASVQVAFGMVIGFVCVYIGLMMTWFGIDASYNFSGKLDAAGSKGEVSLKSRQPGPPLRPRRHGADRRVPLQGHRLQGWQRRTRYRSDRVDKESTKDGRRRDADVPAQAQSAPPLIR